MSLVLVAALAFGYQDTVNLMGRATHVMADADGKTWQHDNPEFLLKWIEQRNAQIKAGKRPAPRDDAPINYGLDPKKYPASKGKTWYGGNVPPKYGDATDKAKRVHVTVIGKDAEGIVKAWEADPGFASLKTAMGDRLAIQAFTDPEDPLVKNVGLPNGGKPDVVIQEASGKVVYRAKADPGPAVIVGEVRKRDPAYDPNKDPSGGLTGDASKIVVWGVVLAVLYLAYRSQPNA